MDRASSSAEEAIIENTSNTVIDNSFSYSEDDMFETQTQVHAVPLEGPETTINKKDEIYISESNTDSTAEKKASCEGNQNTNTNDTNKEKFQLDGANTFASEKYSDINITVADAIILNVKDKKDNCVEINPNTNSKNNQNSLTSDKNQSKTEISEKVSKIFGKFDSSSAATSEETKPRHSVEIVFEDIVTTPLKTKSEKLPNNNNRGMSETVVCLLGNEQQSPEKSNSKISNDEREYQKQPTQIKISGNDKLELSETEIVVLDSKDNSLNKGTEMDYEDDDDDEDDSLNLHYTPSQDVLDTSKEEGKNSQSLSSSTQGKESSDGSDKDTVKMEFSFDRGNIISPEEPSPDTDSCSIFSRVKEVADLKPGESFPRQTLEHSKRKRDLSSDLDNEEKRLCKENRNSDVNDFETQVISSPFDRIGTSNYEKGDEATAHSPIMNGIPLSSERHSSAENNVHERVLETEREILIKSKVKLHFNEITRNVLCYEIIQCDLVEECLRPATRAESDLSSGNLADDSKNTSPCSTVSLGPFPLGTRISVISTSSSSSAGSIAQAIQALKLKRFSENSPVQDQNFNSGCIINMDAIENVVRSLNVDHHDPIFVSPKGVSHIPRTRKSEKRIVMESSSPLRLTKSEGFCSVNGNRLSELRSLNNKQNPEISVNTKSENEIPEESTEVVSTGSPARSPKASPQVRKQDPSTPVNRKVETGGRTNSRQRKTKMDQEETCVTPTRKRGGKRVGSSTPRPKRLPEVTCTPVLNASWGTEDVSRFKCQFEKGSPAFARWTDKRYYSAKITEKQRDGRWLVNFDDGEVKSLKEDFIIPVNSLSKGQIVYAMFDDKNGCGEGVITKFEVKNNEVMYGVELDDNGQTVFVSRKNIFLTEPQAKLLQEGALLSFSAPSTPKRHGEVDLDNVIHHKRVRTPLHSIRTPGPSGSGMCKRLSHSPSSSDKGSVSAQDEIFGVEPEGITVSEHSFITNSRGKGPGKIKGKGRVAQDNSELDESLGPIPTKNSKLFEGMLFMLTSVDFEPRNTEKSGTRSDSDGEKEFSMSKFVKNRLKQQLEAGGGIVFDNIDDAPEDQYHNCYLIANRPSLTAKYIQCLARGIMIISHDYVIRKCKGENVSPHSYTLPLGWSLEDEAFVGNTGDFHNRTRKMKLLNRKKIAVVNESVQFLKFWESILLDLGARVTRITPDEISDSELKAVDIIVADSSCPPGVQDRAREWRKPLVSTVWIKQCLIQREACPFDGHLHYRFDYCD